jgi:hypothetical protein
LEAEGDSGGGVYDDNGLLIVINSGITTAGSTGYFTDTFAIGLWEKGVQTWITETTAVPIPGAISLLGTEFLCFAAYRRKVKIQANGNRKIVRVRNELAFFNLSV